MDGGFVALIAVFTFLVFAVTSWLVLYCTKDGRSGWASNQKVDNVTNAAVINKEIVRSIECLDPQAYFDKVNVKCLSPFLDIVFIAPEPA